LPITVPPGLPFQSTALTGPRANQIQIVANYIQESLLGVASSAVSQNYVTDWTNYANDPSNAKYSVGSLFQAWFLNRTGFSALLGQDIAVAPQAAAGAAATIPAALPSISPEQLTSGIWGTLTSHSLWVRVGEGIAAIVLLAIGLKAFTGVDPVSAAVKRTPLARTAKLLK
jgi:hypothetical protein